MLIRAGYQRTIACAHQEAYKRVIPREPFPAEIQTYFVSRSFPLQTVPDIARLVAGSPKFVTSL